MAPSNFLSLSQVMADTSSQCATCRREAATLKRCAKCRSAYYCSRDCQKSDWKFHKKACSKNAASISSQLPEVEHSHLKHIDVQITDPFTRLDENRYLHGRSEKDVFKLLIDAFRMRQEDNYNIEGNSDGNSVYSGTESSIEGFRNFLRLASSKPSLLPPWWTPEKQRECEAFSQDDNKWSLRSTVDKNHIMEKYGERTMPMQLRMLAEVVYGQGPGGQDGTAMREMMMAMEGGSIGGAASMINMQRPF